ncbi:protoporphyrinogen oxidase [Orussus abietinus]|uniref:protoporphyrinogen oxidase n=1 Tax=Orussus abietinus TaxID=222816 RepID=UPI0006250316|nr:protoporphyrinogen oxidase [Orussus abietinus]
MTAILGGGIAGLSAAYYALNNPKIGPVILFEASNRLGGWIRTRKSKSGASFEEGPRTIRLAGIGGKNTLDLIDRLDLTDQIFSIKRNHPAIKNKMFFVDNKLCRAATVLQDLLIGKKFFDMPIIQMIRNDLKAERNVRGDESIYNFIERKMSKDVADKVISPVLCGICAGDARQISVNFLLRTIFELEQQHGSIIKGIVKKKLKEIFTRSNEENESNTNTVTQSERLNKRERTADIAKAEKWAIVAFKEGLEEFPKKLASNVRLRGGDILIDHKCEKVTFKPNRVELVVNGETKEYSRVISSLPAKKLASLLHRQHPQLARELEAIPTVTVAVVNLQFSGHPLSLQAFGLLVPPKEKLPILGIIFDSCLSSDGSSTVMTVMMGGAWFEEYFGKSPSKDHLLSVAVEHLKSILQIPDDPVEFNVAILQDCIPQHIVGHVQRLKRITNYISAHGIPLALCGSSYQGVGINDVILSAKQAVSDSVCFS